MRDSQYFAESKDISGDETGVEIQAEHWDSFIGTCKMPTAQEYVVLYFDSHFEDTWKIFRREFSNFLSIVIW